MFKMIKKIFYKTKLSDDTTLSEINPDLLELIFRYLDPASVKAASQVSRLISMLTGVKYLLIF